MVRRARNAGGRGTTTLQVPASPASEFWLGWTSARPTSTTPRSVLTCPSSKIFVSSCKRSSIDSERIGLMYKDWHPLDQLQWQGECMHWHGEILAGEFTHYCPDWDYLPIDETCDEFECCTCDWESKQEAANVHRRAITDSREGLITDLPGPASQVASSEFDPRTFLPDTEQGAAAAGESEAPPEGHPSRRG